MLPVCSPNVTCVLSSSALAPASNAVVGLNAGAAGTDIPGGAPADLLPGVFTDTIFFIDISPAATATPAAIGAKAGPTTGIPTTDLYAAVAEP